MTLIVCISLIMKEMRVYIMYFVHTYMYTSTDTYAHTHTGDQMPDVKLAHIYMFIHTRSLISCDVAVTARFPFPLVHFSLALSFKGGNGILQQQKSQHYCLIRMWSTGTFASELH